MHFHLPKPAHGWRELAGEVGIIVLGVLIALGAEQTVENIRARHEVSPPSDRIVQAAARIALMNVQLPKPLHGCRELARSIVVSSPC